MRTEFARDARNVDALVIIENRELVIDHLHGDMRCLALDKSGVDDIVRMHVTAALELRLLCIDGHVGDNGIHRTPGT